MRLLVRSAGAGSCDYATPFDPYWSVLLWNKHGSDSFSQFEPIAPPNLECLMKRVPKSDFSDAARREAAENLLVEAAKRTTTDPVWEHLMWQSVRLFPCDKNLPPWLKFLSTSKYDEYLYFERLYNRLQCPSKP